ncbi:MAG: Gfo/Idh/MocA family oxidoreductase [Candidatus Hydrogenedentes bacterium]|nr:Gfo/Idh/MocA family oxidoreductase [Candidatus Hydrogenedentota bacterium]
MHRIGIVGAGHFARAHLSALGRHASRARVVLTARMDASAPWPEAEAIGAVMASAEALLASPDIDTVLICSPSHLHADHAITALRAGKHVFCEKPMALSVDRANAMADAAEENGRILMVGHLTRHAPLYTLVAESLFSGRLGRPLAAHASRVQSAGSDRMWRMDPRMGGGVAFDLLIHDLDLLNWFLGAPLNVSALGHRHALGAFDHISAVYTHTGGVVASAEASFLLRPGARSRAMLRVICERGHIEADTVNAACPILIYEEGKPVEGPPADLADALARGLYSEHEEFLDALDGVKPARLRLEDAGQAVLTAVKTIESADGNGRLTSVASLPASSGQML